MPELLPLDCQNFHYIIQNPCKHSRGHNFVSDFMNLGHNIYFCKQSLMFGHEGSKYRSPGQILQKPRKHSIRQSFGSIMMKLDQDVCLDNI